MKHEYHEGPEDLERFEKGMTKLFRAAKPRVKPAGCTILAVASHE